MLDTLRFVRGAVSDKDNVLPVLTHFCAYAKRLQGANGRISIDAPCPEIEVEVVVPAEKFLRAVDACKGEPKLRMTEGGKLVVERRPFRAALPCLSMDAFPKATPSAGKKAVVGKDLLPTLRVLRPFVADDASRPWASTMLFDVDSGWVVAANNACIAGLPVKSVFKQTAQIPIFVIDELIRIAEPPEHYAMDDVSITFFWGDRWLRSQLINADYPIDTILKWLSEKTKMATVPPNLNASIQKIVPFCNDPKFPIIHFKESGIATAPGDSQAEIAGIKAGVGAFRADNLEPMLKCSDAMGITERAAIFSGPNGFRGVMASMRTGSA